MRAALATVALAILFCVAVLGLALIGWLAVMLLEILFAVFMYIIGA